MYGWWRSFEHYSVPGSRPVAVSKSLDLVEQHARADTASYEKRPVIGRLTGDQWLLGFKLHADERVPMATGQAVKYQRARAGGVRGNMGQVPPESETAITSIDLDAGE
ncbi:hypothetical protein [Nocardia sp. CA-290969]|uniref:hypothetical protein n=1 Tax=Nocardia sp. CA-290969 TaxID=3239986 RepID=UPI003D94BBCB